MNLNQLSKVELKNNYPDQIDQYFLTKNYVYAIYEFDKYYLFFCHRDQQNIFVFYVENETYLKSWEFFVPNSLLSKKKLF